MNFLQLCQRTREKCGISGNGPSAVTNQAGENLRIVNWVNEAWQEIQNAQPDWFWMRGTFSINATADKQDYTLADAGVPDLAYWRDDTLRAYRPSIGVKDEQFIRPFEYESFRDVYQYATRVRGRPAFFAVRPMDLALLLGPTPMEAFTVVGEYQKRASTMAANADVPGLPEQFHMLIVYGAMERYAAYEGAPEVMVSVDREYNEMRSRLMANQLQHIQILGPLA